MLYKNIYYTHICDDVLYVHTHVQLYNNSRLIYSLLYLYAFIAVRPCVATIRFDSSSYMYAYTTSNVLVDDADTTRVYRSMLYVRVHI